MSPTFCRHNRFVDRCPICRETVPGQTSARRAIKSKRAGTASGTQAEARASAGRGATSRAGAGARGQAGRTSTRQSREVRVHHEVRARDDGYRCELVAGLHASEDARRLAHEIGFAGGRLLALGASPPSFYTQAHDCGDIEQATWMCFLAAYLSPLQGDQAFSGIREALLSSSWTSDIAPDLREIPLGPRTSHDPARGSETLVAYRRFVEHAGSQQRAFAGEPEWTSQRRFARLFERLALPGFGRMGRYDLLVTLGGLGLYELCADSLQLVTRSPQAASDRTSQAAKRVFGIGDPIIIERRAHALVEALSMPIEVLDLALYNWSTAGPAQERVTLGFPADECDVQAVQRAEAALGICPPAPVPDED
ncbi:MAG TPA: hypothetical protein VK701_09020 [Solirubrobacteraceae bacterium]|nr:hypothetical protein [Solirubrobacteraceae bacterium]